jgi:hypothetical protein
MLGLCLQGIFFVSFTQKPLCGFPIKKKKKKAPLEGAIGS